MSDNALHTRVCNFIAEQEGDAWGVAHYDPGDLMEFADLYVETYRDDANLSVDDVYRVLGIKVSWSGDPGDPDMDVRWSS